ncbi:putative autocrine motility factor receptor amfr [Fasciolopsis buskii]|uniref:Putative autocrine motility factor receptor amfr n=1 Tax=Fasciolopsis buskii TaxID=27845 RepID=A0A8E0S501_9TREM|nr:putative autocrine motility factor receptor amfr [Fasciolopsis buski]
MVPLIAGTGMHTALRLVLWPFRSEMRLFLILYIVSLFVCIVELILNPDLNGDDFTEQQAEDVANALNTSIPTTTGTTDDGSFSASMLEVKSVFIPCVFSLFSVIFVLGKLLQFVFFGSLSEIERGNLSRLLFRFTVFRVIILSGAINVSRLSSVFGWLVWFGALGLLHACALTAMSRCNQLAASSSVSRREWIRLSCALIFLFIGNWYVFSGGMHHCFLLADINVVNDGDVVVTGRSLSSGFKSPTALGVLKSKLSGRRELIYDAMDVEAYILAECMLLFCLIIHLFGGFLIHAFDRWQLFHGRSWPQQTTFSYYLDLIHVLVYRCIEIAHYLHLLLWSRIFSVASLIVFLHIRFAYSMLANRIRQHLAHRRLSRYISEHFELRTSKSAEKNADKVDSELDSTKERSADKSKPNVDEPSKKDKSDEPTLEVCAICWESMRTWRRLPCRHNFHEACLRSWLEQNPTCPTCRRDLGIPNALLVNANRNAATVGGATTNEQATVGLLWRNLVRNAEGALYQPAHGETTGQAVARVVRPTPGQRIHDGSATGGPARNLFATAVGLNLAMSIGSGPMVTAAAQAVARDAAAPSVAHAGPSSSSSVEGGATSSSGESSSRPSSSHQQQLPAGTSDAETVAVEEDNQVRRRSFHFDGSRYFSWLPSLHVELSDVIREVFAVGADQFTQDADDLNVRPTNNALSMQAGTLTGAADSAMSGNQIGAGSFNPEQYELIRLPSGLRQPAREIASMFPQFPLSTIVADLLRTGVPEVTVDNLISRPSPRVSFSPPVSAAPSASSSTFEMATADRYWIGSNPRANQVRNECTTFLLEYQTSTINPKFFISPTLFSHLSSLINLNAYKC